MPEKVPEKPSKKLPKEKLRKPPKAPPAPPEAPPAETLAPKKPRKKVRRGLKKMFGRELTEEDIDDIAWDLQVTLLESDVAVPVADKIIELMKKELVGKKIGRREDTGVVAEQALRNAIAGVLTPETVVEPLKILESKKAAGEPTVIVFVGVNGHGKTTTIAKLAKYLLDRGYKPVIAAGDTFRAAAIEQLEVHSERLGVRLIKHKRGADAAAVAYDAVQHAKARGIDAVLIDTAGRMQTNIDLMDEVKKICRVTKPDLTIFVGDALTGNDAVEQAAKFNEAIGIDGSILCKMDADARGGAALSIAQVTGKPILFIGTGQEYDDLVEFRPEILLDALFGD